MYFIWQNCAPDLCLEYYTIISSNCLQYAKTSLLKQSTLKYLPNFSTQKNSQNGKFQTQKSFDHPCNFNAGVVPPPPPTPSWAVKNYQLKVIIPALYQKTNRCGKWPKMGMRLCDFMRATLSLILKSLSYFEYHLKFLLVKLTLILKSLIFSSPLF